MAVKPIIMQGTPEVSDVTAGTVGSLLPSGTVLPFAGSTAPTGWLLCDGTAVSRTTYANLFAAISTYWGYGNNSTTFNLPDLRGRFLRGRDGGIARDPDRASRTAANTGGATGDNVGSVQDDKMQGHFHQIRHNASDYDVIQGRSGAEAPGIGRVSVVNNTSDVLAMSISGARSDGTNGTPRTGAETRPVNANVNYIIKI
jgi:microcystin-dependent protein